MPLKVCCHFFSSSSQHRRCCLLQLSREENAEATKKVEEIRPLRRSVNHAAALMQQKQFPHALQLLNQVIEVSAMRTRFL